MSSLKLLSIASGLLLIALFGQVSSAKETTIFDQDEATLDIERVAQVICEVSKGADKQISRFSTIQSLIDFFKSISPDHKLAECSHQYLPAFEHMQLILDTANEDVCSDTKISLIESFHRNFVSKARKYRKEQKANQLVAPKLLKLFYMHYTSAISATCARSAVQELRALQIDGTAEKNENESQQATSNQLLNLIGTINPSNGYKDMFLVWNFIDSLPLEKDTKISRYLHEGKKRIFLKTQKAHNVQEIQESCNSKLKPFYSLSLLAVVRLADLGFYPEDESLIELISSSQFYAEFYRLVQLCETLLPIYVIKDESLKPSESVVMSKAETASLSIDESVSREYVPYNPLNRVDSIDAEIANDSSQKFIKKVKENVDSRVSVQNKIFIRIIRKFKSTSDEENSSQLILNDGSTKEDLNSILHESLPKLDELHPLGALEGEDEDASSNETTVGRKKRGFMRYVKNTLSAVLIGFLTIIYAVIWLIVAIAKIYILTPIMASFYLIEKLLKLEKESLTEKTYRFLYFLPPNLPRIAYRRLWVHSDKPESDDYED